MKNRKIVFNSPVVLIFAAICFAATIMNGLSGGWTNKAFFMVYHSSPASPLTYVRFISHIFGHASWGHFAGNMCYILLLGPML